MENTLSTHFSISQHINDLLKKKQPIVALESTVITHGLPRPQNLDLANDMERMVLDNDATPATIALLDGTIKIGLTPEEMERLANEEKVRKISRRDFATAVVKKECGGTTVAGTMFAANRAGIRIFATGGIGGVHEVDTMDISTDLQALSDTPMIVICAGAKAILDLHATMEYLETMAVPVVGYGTDEFPAFYSRGSGLFVSVRLDTPLEIVEFAKTHWELGMSSAILVCQPLPHEDEIPREKIDGFIRQAQDDAHDNNIHGQELTPFLLARLTELTNGESLNANLKLLKNNAKLAARIAVAWSKSGKETATDDVI